MLLCSTVMINIEFPSLPLLAAISSSHDTSPCTEDGREGSRDLRVGHVRIWSVQQSSWIYIYFCSLLLLSM